MVESNPMHIPEGLISGELTTKLYHDAQIQGIHPFENPNLYQFLDELKPATLETLLNNAWQDDAYVNHFTNLLATSHWSLLFHPGIYANMTEFQNWYETHPSVVCNLSSIELIKHFKAKPLSLYRGMTLTAQELDLINKQGIFAPGCLTLTTFTNYFRRLTDKNQAQTNSFSSPNIFIQDIIYRLAYSTTLAKSGTLSLSSHEEVAASVGYWNSNRTNEKDVLPVIFEVQVPSRLIYDEFTIMKDKKGDLQISIADKIFSQGIEYFMPTFLPTQMITAIRVYPNPPPRWSVYPKVVHNEYHQLG
jgi:hypothetical protein